jgi:hypothetical protein
MLQASGSASGKSSSSHPSPQHRETHVSLAGLEQYKSEAAHLDDRVEGLRARIVLVLAALLARAFEKFARAIE